MYPSTGHAEPAGALMQLTAGRQERGDVYVQYVMQAIGLSPGSRVKSEVLGLRGPGKQPSR